MVKPDDEGVPPSEELIHWAEGRDDRSIHRKVWDFIKPGEVHRYVLLILIGAIGGTYWGISIQKTNPADYSSTISFAVGMVILFLAFFIAFAFAYRYPLSED